MVVLAADFATGILVVTVEVTTVGVGSAVRVGFMGEVGLAGIGWAITHTLNLLFTGALALFFFSAFLGTRVFVVNSFCQVIRCWCVVVIVVGYQACPLVLNRSSFFLLGMGRDRVLYSRGYRI